jgi:hypothetical protein
MLWWTPANKQWNDLASVNTLIIDKMSMITTATLHDAFTRLRCVLGVNSIVEMLQKIKIIVCGAAIKRCQG